MANDRLIGDTTWSRMPGGTETSSDDGRFSVTRLYNGAITEGAGGTGEVSWAAFRAAYPPGTPDPIYGSSALSTAFPSITEARNETYVASITFSGGTFESGLDTTKPQITWTLISKEIEVKHPEDATLKVGLNYQTIQTTVKYAKEGSAPSTAGEKSNLADTTAPAMTDPPILQNLPDKYVKLTNTEISDRVEPSSGVVLTGFEAHKRSEAGGNVIWEVTESWARVLVNK